MKTVCVALALVGSASAFVTPMATVRATSTRYCCRFLPPVLIRHVCVLDSVCDANASRGNARSAQESVALLCCTGGPSQWFHRAFGRIPRNAHIFVRSRPPYVLFCKRDKNGCEPLGCLSGVLVRPRNISGRDTINVPFRSPTTHDARSAGDNHTTLTDPLTPSSSVIHVLYSPLQRVVHVHQRADVPIAGDQHCLRLGSCGRCRRCPPQRRLR